MIRVRRPVAAFLAFLFLVNFVMNPGAAAQTPSDVSSRFASGASVFPSGAGKIIESFAGDSSRPSVILIQDAHSIPEAQRNIRALIDYFQKADGVRTVAAEGAAGPFDARLLRSFPETGRLKEVFDSFTDKGEVTGVSLAALFNETPALYTGIEDWDLYQQGLPSYLLALKQRGAILGKLDEEKSRLEKEKDSAYSAELREIDRALEGFEEGRTDFLAALETLARVAPPPADSPLTLLVKEGMKGGTDERSAGDEVRALAEKIRKRLEESQAAAFNAKYQDFLTSRTAAGEFASFLIPLADGMTGRIAADDFQVSPRLRMLAESHRRLRELEGTEVLRAFTEYAGDVKQRAFRNKKERALDARSRGLGLLRKLASLELPRSEWEETRQLLSGGAENFPAGGGLTPGDFAPHRAFYENAGRREDNMFRRLTKLLAGEGRGAKRASVLLVAGGFHAQGLVRRLRESNTGYRLVVPAITAVPDSSGYVRQMQGEVTWKDYFRAENGKIDLNAAFIRAARDRLLAVAREPGTHARLVKEWRDEVIRDLAAEKRIERAGEYTRFLDEAVKPSGSGKADDPLGRTEAFIQGLLELKARGRITDENVLRLFRPSTRPADAVAAALVPHSVLDVKVPGLEASVFGSLAAGGKAVLPAAAAGPAPSDRSEIRNAGPGGMLPAMRALSVEIERLYEEAGSSLDPEHFRMMKESILRGEIAAKGEDTDVLKLSGDVSSAGFSYRSVGRFDLNYVHALGFPHWTERAFVLVPEGVAVMRRLPGHPEEYSFGLFGGHERAGDLKPGVTAVREVGEELIWSGASDLASRSGLQLLNRQEFKHTWTEKIHDWEIRNNFVILPDEGMREKLLANQRFLKNAMASRTPEEYAAWLEARRREGIGEAWSIDLLTWDQMEKIQREGSLEITDRFRDGARTYRAAFTDPLVRDPGILERLKAIAAERETAEAVRPKAGRERGKYTIPLMITLAALAAFAAGWEIYRTITNPPLPVIHMPRRRPVFASEAEAGHFLALTPEEAGTWFERARTNRRFGVEYWESLAIHLHREYLKQKEAGRISGGFRNNLEVLSEPLEHVLRGRNPEAGRAAEELLRAIDGFRTENQTPGKSAAAPAAAVSILRSEVRVDGNLVKAVLAESDPAAKIEKIRDLVRQTPGIQQKIAGTAAELSMMSMKPMYTVDKDGSTVIFISFHLGEVSDYETGKSYWIANLPKTDFLSQKDFFALELRSDDNESITMKQLFESKGLGRAAESLLLERTITFSFDEARGTLHLFERVGGSPFSTIVLGFDKAGEPVFSGIEYMEDFDRAFYIPRTTVPVFEMHFHPGGSVTPSASDMETFTKSGLPEMILLSSLHGKIWAPKDVALMRTVIGHRGWKVFAAAVNEKIAADMLVSVDLAPADFARPGSSAPPRSETRSRGNAPALDELEESYRRYERLEDLFRPFSEKTGMVRDGTIYVDTPLEILPAIFDALSEFKDLRGKNYYAFGAGILKDALAAAWLYGMNVTAVEKDERVSRTARRVEQEALKEGLIDAEHFKFHPETDAFEVSWADQDVVFFFYTQAPGSQSRLAFDARLQSKLAELKPGAIVALLYTSAQIGARYDAHEPLAPYLKQTVPISDHMGGLYLKIYQIPEAAPGFRSEVRTDPELVGSVLQEQDPARKLENIRTLIRNTPGIQQKIAEAARKLSRMSTAPMYEIHRDGRLVLSVSFALGEVVDYTKHPVFYKFVEEPRSAELSQDEFFSLQIESGRRGKITVRELFESVGLGSALAGLPLERSVTVSWEPRTGLLRLQENVSEALAPLISIAYDREGRLVSSGVGDMHEIRDVRNLTERADVLFQMHFHPVESVFPSRTDIATIAGAGVPEMILGPSMNGKIWAPKDLAQLRALTRHRGWEHMMGSVLENIAGQYLLSLDITPEDFEASPGGEPGPARRSETRGPDAAGSPDDLMRRQIAEAAARISAMRMFQKAADSPNARPGDMWVLENETFYVLGPVKDHPWVQRAEDQDGFEVYLKFSAMPGEIAFLEAARGKDYLLQGRVLTDTEGRQVLVLPAAGNESLADWLGTGRIAGLAAGQRKRLAAKILQALETTRALGYINIDVTAENVMLRQAGDGAEPEPTLIDYEHVFLRERFSQDYARFIDQSSALLLSILTGTEITENSAADTPVEMPAGMEEAARLWRLRYGPDGKAHAEELFDWFRAHLPAAAPERRSEVRGRASAAPAVTRRGFLGTAALASLAAAFLPGAAARAVAQTANQRRNDKIESWKRFLGEGAYNSFLVDSLNGKKDAANEKALVAEAEVLDPKLAELMRDMIAAGSFDKQVKGSKKDEFQDRFNALLEPLGLYASLEYYSTVQERELTFGFLIYEISFRRRFLLSEKGGQEFTKDVRFLKKVSVINVLPPRYGDHLPTPGVANIFLENTEQEAEAILDYVANPYKKVSGWLFDLEDKRSFMSSDSVAARIKYLEEQFGGMLSEADRAALKKLGDDLAEYTKAVDDFNAANPEFRFQLRADMLAVNRIGELYTWNTIERLGPKDRAAWDGFAGSDRVKPLLARLKPEIAAFGTLQARIAAAVDSALDKPVRAWVEEDLRDLFPAGTLEAAMKYGFRKAAETEIAQLVRDFDELVKAGGRWSETDRPASPMSPSRSGDLAAAYREASRKVGIEIPQFEIRLNWWNWVWSNGTGIEKVAAYEEVSQGLNRILAELTGLHEFRHAYDSEQIRRNKGRESDVLSEVKEALAYGTVSGYDRRLRRTKLIQVLSRVMNPAGDASGGAIHLMAEGMRRGLKLEDAPLPWTPDASGAFLTRLFAAKDAGGVEARKFLDSKDIEPDYLRTPPDSIKISIEDKPVTAFHAAERRTEMLAAGPAFTVEPRGPASERSEFRKGGGLGEAKGRWDEMAESLAGPRYEIALRRLRVFEDAAVAARYFPLFYGLQPHLRSLRGPTRYLGREQEVEAAERFFRENARFIDLSDPLRVELDLESLFKLHFETRGDGTDTPWLAQSWFRTLVLGPAREDILAAEDFLLRSRGGARSELRDRSMRPSPYADPLKPKEQGEAEQIAALAGLGVSDFDRFYFTLGDFDLLSAINKLMSKPIVGSLGSKLSPDVAFAYHSLYRETREILQQIFEGRIHRYVGGDEIAPELYGPRKDVRLELARAVRALTKAFNDHYAVLRIDDLFEFGTLDSDLIEFNEPILVVSQYDKGVNLLVDRSLLTPGEYTDLKEWLSEVLVLTKGQLRELGYEKKGRGLFTMSLGSLSAKQLLDYVVSIMGEDYWLSEGKLRPERAEQFYRLGMMAANDMLKHAKDSGRNQAFLAPASRPVGELLFKKWNPAQIETLAGRIEAGQMDFDTLTGLRLPGLFYRRIEEEIRGLEDFITVGVGDYGYGSERSFHLFQEEAGYDTGNAVIRRTSEIIARMFGLDAVSAGERFMTRQAPDTFHLAGKNLNVTNPPDFSRIGEGLPPGQSGRPLALKPHLIVYKISKEKVLDLYHSPIVGLFTGLTVAESIHWLSEMLTSLPLAELREAADVTEHEGYTLVEFNEAKIKAFYWKYRESQDRQLSGALKKLRSEPVGPRRKKSGQGAEEPGRSESREQNANDVLENPYREIEYVTRGLNIEDSQHFGELKKFLDAKREDFLAGRRADPDFPRFKVLVAGAGAGVLLYDLEVEYGDAFEFTALNKETISIPEEIFSRIVWTSHFEGLKVQPYRAWPSATEDEVRRSVHDFYGSLGRKIILTDLTRESPVMSAHYDAVIVGLQVMPYIRDKLALVRRIQNTLNPGGAAFIADFDHISFEPVIYYEDFFDALNRLAGADPAAPDRPYSYRYADHMEYYNTASSLIIRNTRPDAAFPEFRLLRVEKKQPRNLPPKHFSIYRLPDSLRPRSESRPGAAEESPPLFGEERILNDVLPLADPKYGQAVRRFREAIRAENPAVIAASGKGREVLEKVNAALGPLADDRLVFLNIELSYQENGKPAVKHVILADYAKNLREDEGKGIDVSLLAEGRGVKSNAHRLQAYLTEYPSDRAFHFHKLSVSGIREAGVGTAVFANIILAIAKARAGADRSPWELSFVDGSGDRGKPGPTSTIFEKMAGAGIITPAEVTKGSAKYLEIDKRERGIPPGNQDLVFLGLIAPRSEDRLPAPGKDDRRAAYAAALAKSIYLKTVLEDLGTPDFGAATPPILEALPAGTSAEENTVFSVPFELSEAGNAFFGDVLGRPVSPGEASLLLIGFPSRGLVLPYSVVFQNSSGEFDHIDVFTLNQAVQKGAWKQGEGTAATDGAIGLRLFETLHDALKVRAQGRRVDGAMFLLTPEKNIPEAMRGRSFDLIHITRPPYEGLRLKEIVMSPRGEFHQDFIAVLQEHAPEFRGKHAGIIGTGQGEDILQAVWSGAAQVSANDISQAAVSVSRWNIGIAHAAGLVPDGVPITITHAGGLDGVRDAEVFAWNNGGIYPARARTEALLRENSPGSVQHLDIFTLSDTYFADFLKELGDLIAGTPKKMILRIDIDPNLQQAGENEWKYLREAHLTGERAHRRYSDFWIVQALSAESAQSGQRSESRRPEWKKLAAEGWRFGEPDAREAEDAGNIFQNIFNKRHPDGAYTNGRETRTRVLVNPDGDVVAAYEMKWRPDDVRLGRGAPALRAARLFGFFAVDPAVQLSGYGEVFFEQIKKEWRAEGFDLAIVEDATEFAAPFWRKQGGREIPYRLSSMGDGLPDYSPRFSPNGKTYYRLVFDLEGYDASLRPPQDRWMNAAAAGRIPAREATENLKAIHAKDAYWSAHTELSDTAARQYGLAVEELNRLLHVPLARPADFKYAFLRLHGILGKDTIRGAGELNPPQERFADEIFVKLYSPGFDARVRSDAARAAAEIFTEWVDRNNEFNEGNHRFAGLLANYILMKAAGSYVMLTPENVAAYEKIANPQYPRTIDTNRLAAFFRKNMRRSESSQTAGAAGARSEARAGAAKNKEAPAGAEAGKFRRPAWFAVYDAWIRGGKKGADPVSDLEALGLAAQEAALRAMAPAARSEKVKKAYRLLARIYHPDVYHGGDEIFKRIQNAYDAAEKPEFWTGAHAYTGAAAEDEFEFMDIDLPPWMKGTAESPKWAWVIDELRARGMTSDMWGRRDIHDLLWAGSDLYASVTYAGEQMRTRTWDGIVSGPSDLYKFDTTKFKYADFQGIHILEWTDNESGLDVRRGPNDLLLVVSNGGAVVIDTLSRAGKPVRIDVNPYLSRTRSGYAYEYQWKKGLYPAEGSRGLLIDPSIRGGDYRFAPDGSSVTFVTGDGEVLVWDLERGTYAEHCLPIAVNEFSRPRIELSPGGNFALASHYGGTSYEDRRPRIEIWDVEDGALMASYEIGEGELHGASWEPDGSISVSGNRPGTEGPFRTLWDWARDTEKPAEPESGPRERQTSVASPNGLFAATVENERLKITETGTQSEIAYRILLSFNLVYSKMELTQNAMPKLKDFARFFWAPDGRRLLVVQHDFVNLVELDIPAPKALPPEAKKLARPAEERTAGSPAEKTGLPVPAKAPGEPASRLTPADVLRYHLDRLGDPWRDLDFLEGFLLRSPDAMSEIVREYKRLAGLPAAPEVRAALGKLAALISELSGKVVYEDGRKIPAADHLKFNAPLDDDFLLTILAPGRHEPVRVSRFTGMVLERAQNGTLTRPAEFIDALLPERGPSAFQQKRAHQDDTSNNYSYEVTAGALEAIAVAFPELAETVIRRLLDTFIRYHSSSHGMGPYYLEQTLTSLAAHDEFLPYYLERLRDLAMSGNPFHMQYDQHYYVNDLLEKLLKSYEQAGIADERIGAARQRLEWVKADQARSELRAVTFHRNSLDRSLLRYPFEAPGRNQEVNFIDVLEDAAARVSPGNEILVQVSGPINTLPLAAGQLDWRGLDKLDLMIYTDKPLTRDEEWRIRIAFYRELQKRLGPELLQAPYSGEILALKGAAFPRRIEELTQPYAFSQADKRSQYDAWGFGVPGAGTKKTVHVELGFARREDLLKSGRTAGPAAAYRFWNQYYGSASARARLDATLEEAGIQTVAEAAAGIYQQTYDSVSKTGFAADPSPFRDLYELAFLRGLGDESEFRELLQAAAEARQLAGQSGTAEAAEEFGRLQGIYSRALAALDPARGGRESLVRDLVQAISTRSAKPAEGFAGLLRDWFPGSESLNFADLGSGPDAEFEGNLRRVLAREGIEAAPGSVSVESVIGGRGEKAGPVLHADMHDPAVFRISALGESSKDLVTINNIDDREIIRPALRLLKPGGALFVTFAENDIFDDGEGYIRRAVEIARGETADGFSYETMIVARPVDYPASNRRAVTPHESYAKMLVIRKVSTPAEPRSESRFAGGKRAGPDVLPMKVRVSDFGRETRRLAARLKAYRGSLGMKLEASEYSGMKADFKEFKNLLEDMQNKVFDDASASDAWEILLAVLGGWMNAAAYNVSLGLQMKEPAVRAFLEHVRMAEILCSLGELVNIRSYILNGDHLDAAKILALGYAGGVIVPQQKPAVSPDVRAQNPAAFRSEQRGPDETAQIFTVADARDMLELYRTIGDYGRIVRDSLLPAATRQLLDYYVTGAPFTRIYPGVLLVDTDGSEILFMPLEMWLAYPLEKNIEDFQAFLAGRARQSGTAYETLRISAMKHDPPLETAGGQKRILYTLRLTDQSGLRSELRGKQLSKNIAFPWMMNFTYFLGAESVAGFPLTARVTKIEAPRWFVRGETPPDPLAARLAPVLRARLEAVRWRTDFAIVAADDLPPFVFRVHFEDSGDPLAEVFYRALQEKNGRPVRTPESQAIARSAGRIFAEMHNHGIISNDTHEDQFVADAQGRVRRIDLTKIFVYSPLFFRALRGEGLSDEEIRSLNAEDQPVPAASLRQEFSDLLFGTGVMAHPYFVEPFLEAYLENARNVPAEIQSWIEMVQEKVRQTMKNRNGGQPPAEARSEIRSHADFRTAEMFTRMILRDLAPENQTDADTLQHLRMLGLAQLEALEGYDAAELSEREKDIIEGLRAAVDRLPGGGQNGLHSLNGHSITLNPFLAPGEPIAVTQNVLEEMVRLTERGKSTPDAEGREYGLLLFGRNGVITAFEGGFSGNSDTMSFQERKEPDGRVTRSEDLVLAWIARGYEFMGYFHNHPAHNDERGPMRLAGIQMSWPDVETHYKVHGTRAASDGLAEIWGRWTRVRVNPLQFIGAVLRDGRPAVSAYRMKYTDDSNIPFAVPAPVALRSENRIESGTDLKEAAVFVAGAVSGPAADDEIRRQAARMTAEIAATDQIGEFIAELRIAASRAFAAPEGEAAPPAYIPDEKLEAATRDLLAFLEDFLKARMPDRKFPLILDIPQGEDAGSALQHDYLPNIEKMHAYLSRLRTHGAVKGGAGAALLALYRKFGWTPEPVRTLDALEAGEDGVKSLPAVVVGSAQTYTGKNPLVFSIGLAAEEVRDPRSRTYAGLLQIALAIAAAADGITPAALVRHPELRAELLKQLTVLGPAGGQMIAFTDLGHAVVSPSAVENFLAAYKAAAAAGQSA